MNEFNHSFFPQTFTSSHTQMS